VNATAISLDQFFKVGERFQRSVNLAADYGSERSLDDYVLTSLSNAVLSRVSLGLNITSKNRAWSITGPYGAGKSSAILFLAHVLGYPVNKNARRFLGERNPELLADLYRNQPALQNGGYVVIPVVGSRSPIAWTLLEGLINNLSALPERTEAFTDYIDYLTNVYEQTKQGEIIPATVFEEILRQGAEIIIASFDSALGLLIIYDELGKSLEYAALYPEYADIGLLQVVAEFAARSGDTPISLITVLHQAFEHYAVDLNPVQQREWAKVQGRFEDIGFLESFGELLGIIDKAIHHTEALDIELLRVIDDEVQKGAALELLPRDLPPEKARGVLAGCAPLHPTVTLVLGRLFRSRLSQNERSLFAFLSSGEPFGFQEYLRSETWLNNGYRPFYRLDNLYDYIVAAMGSLLYLQSQGKKWAEIEDALERLPKEAGVIERQLIKAIGLLNILGDQRYLKASQKLLAYALTNGSQVTPADVDDALERLEKWGLAIYRRFKDAYSLWQGSDIDLNERFDLGFAQIDRTQSLTDLLKSRSSIKPFLAKRHLHETGTFRYFEPWIVEMEKLEEVKTRSFGDADGAVVFLLGTNGTPIDEVLTTVRRFSAELTPPRRDTIFFAIPQDTQGIRTALEETLTWEWVAQNTPELEGDSIARRELAARRLATQERLERAAGRCFGAASSYRASHWILAGEDLKFTSARQLASKFSAVCDAVYHQAPIVHNELINRRTLSSAASAARRQLIELMLKNGNTFRLGIEKFPPEVSLYLSVLHASGLHHYEGGTWVFGPDEQQKDTMGVNSLWETIDRFLDETESKARQVPELYATLRQPPYGIKDGLLPIYLVVAILFWGRELAVYEEGRFVPNVGIAECERLIRAPERFALQRYRLDESRKQMLYEYATLFDRAIDPAEINAVMALRPLLTIIKQLPRYTLLTSHLSPEAIAVREALLAAREPQALLFKTLPKALGFAAHLGEGEWVKAYFVKLKETLAELEYAYLQLLQRIEQKVLDTLLLPADLEMARTEIADRCRVLMNWISDLRLKAFAQRLGNTESIHREWLESIAALVSNSPPRNWNDQDMLHFDVALTDIVGQFKRTEEIALSQQSEKPALATMRVARLAVTDLQGTERREIIQLPQARDEEVHILVEALKQTLGALQVSHAVQLMAITQLADEMLSRNEQETEE